MTAAIATMGLTKRFGELPAVADLDLQVQPGEVFGFLGPNGAGKTTTIRMLLDILRPTSGRAEVLGRAPGDTAVRARIGFRPAELHLDRHYTVREAIDFLGALRGGFDESTVRQLLERFDLDPGRTIGDLSTGNRRKVGVTQAFAGRPELPPRPGRVRRERAGRRRLRVARARCVRRSDPSCAGRVTVVVAARSQPARAEPIVPGGGRATVARRGDVRIRRPAGSSNATCDSRDTVRARSRAATSARTQLRLRPCAHDGTRSLNQEREP